MIPILFPIIATILGGAYILSPIDFIPELVVGPIGLSDDIFVGVIIFLSWMIYFTAPLLEIIFSVILVVGVIFGLIMAVNYLYKRTHKRRKVKHY